MTEQKLVVVIMGQNCERFIDMCLESVKDADSIFYLDGGSTDNTKETVQEFLHNNPQIAPSAIWVNPYNQEDKQMNGKQRNFYLDYVKKNYPDWWCLALDADEVVEDLSKIKEFIQSAAPALYSPKMRHFIGDLGHEDAVYPEHWVLNRLFKISLADKYPLGEHPVLQPTTWQKPMGTKATTIWHLAYMPGMWEIKKRYDNHMKKSEIHTPQYLKNWYFQHLFGTYPKAQLNPIEIPDIILRKFGIDKDELYFIGRGLETKHFIDAIHWKDHFKVNSVTEFGCGLGPRVYAMNSIGLDAMGIEISPWAVEHSMDKDHILRGDITDKTLEMHSELCVAYDVLEHIDYDKLPNAIDTLIRNSTKYILVSVPVIGDPNLERDPTHKIKETADWWIKQFTDKGCKLLPTPEHFLYRDQLMILEVNHGTGS